LGRGGSDFSATILGAALDADEVIIWTDVDGVLTADPRLVQEARTIPEVSYREAAELAYFGAKVLHPKTLNPVVQAAIPVWIRNSFAPERRGTKITPKGRSIGGGVKALTAIRDVTLIRDRKSTRLNSSHLGISYAVFCLKKKIFIAGQFDLDQSPVVWIAIHVVPARGRVEP